MKSPKLDKFLGTPPRATEEDSSLLSGSRSIDQDIQQLTHDTDQILDDILHQAEDDVNRSGMNMSQLDDDASLQQELAHLEFSTSELQASLAVSLTTDRASTHALRASSLSAEQWVNELLVLDATLVWGAALMVVSVVQWLWERRNGAGDAI